MLGDKAIKNVGAERVTVNVIQIFSNVASRYLGIPMGGSDLFTQEYNKISLLLYFEV